MRKERLFVIAGLVVGVAGISAIVLLGRPPHLRPDPVSAVYIGYWDARWNRRGGPTFLLWNYTSKALSVSIGSLEVHDGTNWTRHYFRGCCGTTMLAPC